MALLDAFSFLWIRLVQVASGKSNQQRVVETWQAQLPHHCRRGCHVLGDNRVGDRVLYKQNIVCTIPSK